jgi:hypothetical protein
VTCGYINQNPETKGGVMTDLEREKSWTQQVCRLQTEVAALRAENEELKEQVARWKTAAKATMDTLEANQRRTALKSRLEIPRPEVEK